MSETFSRADIVDDPIEAVYALWAEAHRFIRRFDPYYPLRTEWRLSADVRDRLVAATTSLTYRATAADQERLLGSPVIVDETLPRGWMQLIVDDPGPG